jgi:cytochrome c biogenesis protein CcmG, thiol:disulfide interchange protein DsbE
MRQNYYTLLGVSPKATIEEITAAYQAQVRRSSATSQSGEDLEQVQQLQAAIDVLSDPVQRQSYDREQGLSSSEPRGVSGREIIFGVLGVLVGLLVLSGVWLIAGRDTGSVPTVTEVKPYDAPAFTLKNLDGAPVSLDDFKGKVVLLNFWATWCDPCKEETPALEAAYQKLKDQGLVIVGVDLYNAERSRSYGIQEVRQFVNRYGVTYPIVLDESGSVGQAYAIHPIPTSYFIDQQGKVRYLKVGQLNMSDVERIFRSLQATGS